MIVVTTKMIRIPENCKKCSGSCVRHYMGEIERVCSFTNRICPTEKKESGNVGYAMPDWCPLMDIYFPEDE